MKFLTLVLILVGVTKALDSLLDTDDTISAMMRLLKGGASTSTEDIRTLLGSTARSLEPRRQPRTGRTNVKERQEMVKKLKERLQLLEQKETDLRELEQVLRKKKEKLDKRLRRADVDATSNVVRARQLVGSDGKEVKKLRERIDELEDRLRTTGVPSGPGQQLSPFMNMPGHSPTRQSPSISDPLSRSADLDQDIRKKEKIRNKLNEILNRLAERLAEKTSQLRALQAGQMPQQQHQPQNVPGTVNGQQQPWQQQPSAQQPLNAPRPMVQQGQPWPQQPQAQQPVQQPLPHAQGQPWSQTQQQQFQPQTH